MSIDDITPEEWNNIRYYNNDGAVGVRHDPVNRYAPNPDQVHNPSHYTHSGGIECIDAIDAMLGREGSMYAYEANVLKYLWRWRYKGGVESLRKARWYIDRLIKKEVQGG